MLEYRLMAIPKCDACNNSFNEFENCPRLIKTCAHCICQNCLTDLLKTSENEQKLEIKCPLCKKADVLINYTMTNFPKHFTILDSIQRIQEETFCFHEDLSPQDFICFDQTCINFHKFCGLCYFTVHSKCNSNSIIKTKDFSEKTIIWGLKRSLPDFKDSLKADFFNKFNSEVQKIYFEFVLKNITSFLDFELSKLKVPNLEDFIENRQKFISEVDEKQGLINIRPRKIEHLEGLISDISHLIENHRDFSTITDFDILFAQKHVFGYEMKSKEMEFLFKLFNKHSDYLRSLKFDFSKTITEADELFDKEYKMILEKFKNEKCVQSIESEINSSLALINKFKEDISIIEQSIELRRNKISRLKDEVTNFFSHQRISTEFLYIFKKNDIEEIISKFDYGLKKNAQDLTSQFVKCCIKKADFDLIIEKIFHFSEEVKNKIINNFVEGTFFSVSTEILEETWNPIHDENYQFDTFIKNFVQNNGMIEIKSYDEFVQSLEHLKTLDEEVYKLFSENINAVFIFNKETLNDFFVSTRLESENSECKVVMDACENANKCVIKQVEFEGFLKESEGREQMIKELLAEIKIKEELVVGINLDINKCQVIFEERSAIFYMMSQITPLVKIEEQVLKPVEENINVDGNQGLNPEGGVLNVELQNENVNVDANEEQMVIELADIGNDFFA